MAEKLQSVPSRCKMKILRQWKLGKHNKTLGFGLQVFPPNVLECQGSATMLLSRALSSRMILDSSAAQLMFSFAPSSHDPVIKCTAPRGCLRCNIPTCQAPRVSWFDDCQANRRLFSQQVQSLTNNKSVVKWREICRERGQVYAVCFHRRCSFWNLHWILRLPRSTGSELVQGPDNIMLFLAFLGASLPLWLMITYYSIYRLIISILFLCLSCIAEKSKNLFTSATTPHAKDSFFTLAL